MVVFDSSIIIDVLRQKRSAKDLIESYAEKEQISTTVISKYEILRGTTEKDLGLVSGLLSQFVIYDFDDIVVREAVKAHKRWPKKERWLMNLTSS
jgi:predicted nucleic acid-binding protein